MTAPVERPVPSPEDIKSSYGFVALLADAIPELKDILTQAIQGQWTSDRFIMSVANSGWYRQTSPAQREWLTKTITDPAAAEQELAAGARQMWQDAAELGVGGWADNVNESGDTQARKAWLSLKMRGLEGDANARRTTVFDTVGKGNLATDSVGLYGKLASDMFKLAKDYGYQSPNLPSEIVTMLNSQMRTGGTVGTEAWMRKMQNYATAFYAPYAEDIRGGKTVAEIAQPAVDRVAQLLEVNPNAVDVNDPLMRKALTEWNGTTGRAYSLREIEDATRRDARWLKTDNAMDGSVKMLNDIGERFGMLAKG